MNPVNAYLLIKRLTRDWKSIKQLMNANQGDQFIKNITGGRIQNAVGKFVKLTNDKIHVSAGNQSLRKPKEKTKRKSQISTFF